MGVSETLKQLQIDAFFRVTWVVLIVKIDEGAQSILIEQWEDVPRVCPVCARTPTHNLGLVHSII